MAAMHQPLQGGNLLSLETPSLHPPFLLANLLAAFKTCSGVSSIPFFSGSSDSLLLWQKRSSADE